MPFYLGEGKGNPSFCHSTMVLGDMCKWQDNRARWPRFASTSMGPVIDALNIKRKKYFFYYLYKMIVNSHISLYWNILWFGKFWKLTFGLLHCTHNVIALCTAVLLRQNVLIFSITRVIFKWLDYYTPCLPSSRVHSMSTVQIFS